MDRTTEGLESVFAYMDNAHVGSPDRRTHLRHLEIFINALATNGLAINLEKCIFAVPSLGILGHKISVAGAPLRLLTLPKLNFAHPLRI